MSKKKKEIEETPEVTEVEFEYDSTAYLPVWNETFKRYDMLLIRVNTSLEQAVVEREPTKYSEKHRALHDLINRVTKEFK